MVKGETFAKDQTDPCGGGQATTFPNEVAETGVRRTFWQARRRAKREEPVACRTDTFLETFDDTDGLTRKVFEMTDDRFYLALKYFFKGRPTSAILD